MAHVRHDECKKCWTCPDCDARWCITVSDFSHSCGLDDLDAPKGECVNCASCAGDNDHDVGERDDWAVL